MKVFVSALILTFSVFSAYAGKTSKGGENTGNEIPVIIPEESIYDNIESIIQDELKNNPELTSTTIQLKFDIVKEKRGKALILSLKDAKCEDMVADEVQTDDGENDVSEDNDVVTEDGEQEQVGDTESSNGKISVIGIMIAIVITLLAIVLILRSISHLHKISGKRKITNNRAVHRQGSQSQSQSNKTISEQQLLDEARIKEQQIAQQLAHKEAMAKLAAQEEMERREREQNARLERERQAREEAANRKIFKYGQISIPGNNELFVDQDYLTDNSSNMPFEFEFNVDLSEGTYDINNDLRRILAKDASFLRPFTNSFASNPNANEIMTIRQGIIRRKGNGWEIIQRLEIELI